MTQTEVHRLILDEWHGLPLQERRTEAQAVLFAIKICRRYPFRCAGDPYQTIKAWLLRDQSLGGGAI